MNATWALERPEVCYDLSNGYNEPVDDIRCSDTVELSAYDAFGHMATKQDWPGTGQSHSVKRVDRQEFEAVSGGVIGGREVRSAVP